MTAFPNKSDEILEPGQHDLDTESRDPAVVRSLGVTSLQSIRRTVTHLAVLILMLLLLACPDDGSNHGIVDCRNTDPVECPGFDRTFGSNGG